MDFTASKKCDALSTGPFLKGFLLFLFILYILDVSSAVGRSRDIPELRPQSLDAIVEDEASGSGSIWRKDVGWTIAHQLDAMAVDNAGKYAILGVLTAIPYTTKAGLAGLRAEGMKDFSAAIARGIVDALSLTEEQRLRAQDQINVVVAFGNWAGFLQNIAELKGIKYEEFAVELGTVKSTMKDLADGIGTFQMGQGRAGTAGHLAMVDLADKMAEDCGYETAKAIYENVQTELGPFKDEMYIGMIKSYELSTGRTAPYLEKLISVRQLPLNRDNPFKERAGQNFFVYRNEFNAAEEISDELPAKIAVLDPARQAYEKEREQIGDLLIQAEADLKNCKAEACRSKLDQVEDKYFAFKILPGEPRAAQPGCWGWAARSWHHINKRYISEQKWNRPGRDDETVDVLFQVGNQALQDCKISEALDYLERIERLGLKFENDPDHAQSLCMNLGRTRSKERSLRSEIERFLQDGICDSAPEENTGNGQPSGQPPGDDRSGTGGDDTAPAQDGDNAIPPIPPPPVMPPGDGEGDDPPIPAEPPLPPPPPPDNDEDGVANDQDNCPGIYNPGQSDQDGDGKGDRCDDRDKDGVNDAGDNCPSIANPSQADSDGNGIGDACQDSDMDGIRDAADNCPNHPNPGQRDSDNNGYGDACDSAQTAEDRCFKPTDCPIGFDCIQGQCTRASAADNPPPGPPPGQGEGQQPSQGQSGDNALALFGQREDERNQDVGSRSSGTDGTAAGGYSMDDLQQEVDRTQQQIASHIPVKRPDGHSGDGDRPSDPPPSTPPSPGPPPPVPTTPGSSPPVTQPPPAPPGGTSGGGDVCATNRCWYKIKYITTYYDTRSKQQCKVVTWTQQQYLPDLRQRQKQYEEIRAFWERTTGSPYWRNQKISKFEELGRQREQFSNLPVPTTQCR